MTTIYDKSFIDKLISKDIVPTIKKVAQSKGVFSMVFKKEAVEFHPNYNLMVEMHERIKAHAELDTFPERLFRARAPRMTPDEERYLRENYKQVTMPDYLDFLSTINRIFHDANYNLTYQKEDKQGAEKTLQEYLETGIPELDSLENYIKSVATHSKFTDANGIIAIRPRTIKTAVDDEGNTVASESELNEPIPFYFTSAQVLRHEADEFALVWSNEKSMVTVGDQKQRKGNIFEFYDRENIWFIEQVGKLEDYKFKTTLFYNHAWQKLPCVKLKGVPSLQKGKLIWVSPFMYAVDLLDLVAVNSAYLQVIINNCVFPYRVMYGDECEYERKGDNDEIQICDAGYIYDSRLDAKVICPQCGGSGLKSRINPFGVMLIRTGTTSVSDKDMPQTPMAYIEPTIETPKFLMEKIADDRSKARSVLHLNTSQTVVQGGVQQVNPALETATGTMTDLKALYAFVKPISDQIFSIWEFCIDAIGHMRYGSRYKKPLLTYPTTFDFYTEADYMNNIARAVQAGMPPFVIQTILFKYLQSIFYNEKMTANVFNLIYTTDRIITMSNMDISAKASRGVIEKWEVILHDSALTFVQALTNEDEKFFEKPLEEQQVALIDMAKERAEEINDEVLADAEARANMNIDNIMRAAKPTEKAA